MPHIEIITVNAISLIISRIGKLPPSWSLSMCPKIPEGFFLTAPNEGNSYFFSVTNYGTFAIGINPSMEWKRKLPKAVFSFQW